MSNALYNWKILHYGGEQKGEWSQSSSHLLTAWCFTTPGDSGESQSGPLIPTRRKQRGKKKKVVWPGSHNWGGGVQLDTGSSLTAVFWKKGSCILTQGFLPTPSHTFKPLWLPELFPTVYKNSYRFVEGVRLCIHKNTCPKDRKPLMYDF